MFQIKLDRTPDGSATVEGEIYHTSLYALLRVKPAPALSMTLKIKPEVLNLKSEGKNVTAELRLGGGSAGCFDRETINIGAVNGQALAEPIFAQERKKKEHKKYHIECGSITVKFDREDVVSVLPVNAVAEITVSGTLADGRGFNAVDTIRTIKSHKITRRGGGRGEHHKRAACDVSHGALKDDFDLYILSVEGDKHENESRKEAAAKAGRLGRRGYAYEFGPEGAVFDKPVTVSLPYDAGEKAPEKLAIAYWNETDKAWELLSSRRDAAARLVKADVAHFSQYQVVAASYAVSMVEKSNRFRASQTADVAVSAADAEFKLGEVYVYPNPAKGGKVPTFHVEVGIADQVKIRVYTVAGQLVHERSLAGAPQTVGSVYAYEYAWEGRIASGVYYYTIEAEKAGKKLKAKGKFAVIR